MNISSEGNSTFAMILDFFTIKTKRINKLLEDFRDNNRGWRVYDYEFNTTDVCVVVAMTNVTDKYLRHYLRDRDTTS